MRNYHEVRKHRDGRCLAFCIVLTLLAMASIFLAGCGTITVGETEVTPAQRCVGYTAAVARYERILEDEGKLNDAQQVAYDVAVAGQLATCVTAE